MLRRSSPHRSHRASRRGLPARRADQPRARRQRRLHPFARLRPDPPAHRGPELRLGLDRVRRPRHHDAGLAPAGSRLGRARHGPHARGPERDARGARPASPVRAIRWSSAWRGPPAFGDTVRFTVDYHGRIRQGDGLYFFKADGRPHRPQQVYSGGGTDGNPRWLPTWGGPADKATWELVGDRAGEAHRRLQRPPA